MPRKTPYRCNNCGKRFEAETLSKQEVDEAYKRGLLTSSIRCPECNRTDLRRGWE